MSSSTDCFFRNRVYFETSFIIPEPISKESLEIAINQLVHERFEIFLYLVNEIKLSVDKEKRKSEVQLESIQGTTIHAIHNAILSECESDTTSAFRFFFAVDEQGTHYLVIHAHHGVADGFMITSFVRSLYALLNNIPMSESFVFSHIDPFEQLNYPVQWNSGSRELIHQQAEDTVKRVSPAGVYPVRIPDSTVYVINVERIVPKNVSERAVSYARNCGEIAKENGCIHGMLLYAYLRAILKIDELEPSGPISINTVVNMRRYFKAHGFIKLRW